MQPKGDETEPTEFDRAVETLTAIQELLAAPDRSIDEKIDELLEIATDRLDFPIGYVAEIDEDTQEIRAAVGNHDSIQPGATDPIGQTYCRRTIEQADDRYVLTDAVEEGWADDPAFDRFGLQTYIGARIEVSNETFGTLCFADERPRDDLAVDLLEATITTLARHVGYELERTRFERVVETASDAIFMLDAEGRFTMVNDQAARQTGYDRVELLDSHVSLLLPEADYERGRRSIRDLLEDESRRVVQFEAEIECATGETFPIDLRLSPLFEAGEFRGTVGIARDITERKQLARRRKNLLEATRTMLEKVERESIIQFTTDVTADILGFPSNVVRRREDATLTPVAVTEPAHVQLGDRPRYPLDPTDSPAARAFERDEPVVVDDLAALEDGYDRGEARSGLYLPIGDVGVLCVVDVEPAAFDEEDVELASILAANAESAFERLEYEQTIQKQRDRLEMLNNVVRHDVRNDLQVISMRAEVLEDHVDERGMDHLTALQGSAENAVQLTMTARDLAEVILQSDAENCPVALADTLDCVVADVRTAHPDAEVTVDRPLPATDVWANDMLETVFRNLLTNAVQHNDEDDPRVEITAERDTGTVRVKIADNGPGIPEDQRDVIFGKGEKGLDSDGTGIGLYLVHELVTEYGGSVRVEDPAPGDVRRNTTHPDGDTGGAVFVVELQAVE